MHKTDIEILLENTDALKLSLKWINHSFELCKNIEEYKNLDINEYDKLETLTSRFARTTDILFNKVFRSIVLIETGSNKSLLDTLLYFSKVKLIENNEKARFLKELRNDIAHDYLQEDLFELFENIMAHTDELITLAERTINYIDDLMIKLKG